MQIGAAADYSKAERDAWCAALPPSDWAVSRFAGLVTYVAVTDRLVGFMNMDRHGYVDMAFVAPHMHRSGVASALLARLEIHARSTAIQQLSTYASKTARPFFAHHGWDVIRANTVEKGAITLQNWFMMKALS
ncbi:GNAT family N-acetyltransferase [Yoonia sp. 208BN28-4]|uniref:GNAT family N-acetyltransferase n=1 Tax=Yoonia sp. 208BN28-4 TaxID=3126505 RepID=UPI0030ACEE90